MTDERARESPWNVDTTKEAEGKQRQDRYPTLPSTYPHHLFSHDADPRERHVLFDEPGASRRREWITFMRAGLWALWDLITVAVCSIMKHFEETKDYPGLHIHTIRM